MLNFDTGHHLLDMASVNLKQKEINRLKNLYFKPQNIYSFNLSFNFIYSNKI